MLLTANDPHLPSVAYNLEEVIGSLYRKYDKTSEATVTTSLLSGALSRFDAHSEAGQMLRFGMFLAAQLGMETLGKKRGAADLVSLHECLAVTCEDTARNSNYDDN